MVKLLSWNTLCYEDVWFDGWGCPLEIERRDALMELNGGSLSLEGAQRLLTRERYQRIREAVIDEILDNDNDDTRLDFLLFQELTYDDPWDDPKDLVDEQNKFLLSSLSSLYDRVKCQDDYEGNLQRIYVHKESGWTAINSYGLESSVLEGGCLVEFAYNKNIMDAAADNDDDLSILCTEEEAENEVGVDCSQQKLYVVNLHGRSGDMRNPDKRRAGMQALWGEVETLLRHVSSSEDDGDEQSSSWRDRLVMCGDWNTQLTDFLDLFPKWNVPVAALLDNETETQFSTNHEAGFLAQYDGCILASSSALKFNNVERNLTGFMVKGKNGELGGAFSYVHEKGVFYEDSVLPGTLASIGLSDHLRILTDVSVLVGDNKTEWAV